MNRVALLLAVWISLCAALGHGGSCGVVVESVSSGGGADRAGILAGDILLTWTRAANPPANPEPASGRFSSAFQLREIEVEQAQRGPLTIEGLRDGTPFAVAMPQTRWRLHARPTFDDETLGAYSAALEQSTGAAINRGIASLERLARGSAELDRALWLLVKAASLLDGPDRRPRANRLRAAALEMAEARGDLRTQATLLGLSADSLYQQSSFDEAMKLHSRALEIHRAVDADLLTQAMDLNRIGAIRWKQGDLDAARDLWEQVLAIRERQAPGSLDHAASLNNLGILAFDRSDLAAAEELYGRSLGIIERLSPNSLMLAQGLDNLCLVSWHRGDLAKAEEHARRALEIARRLDPGGRTVAHGLTNLGNLALERGDLAAAAASYHQALAIHETLAPDSHEVASLLSNLGTVAFARDDFATAEDYYRRALSIREHLAPGSLFVAQSLINVGLSLRCAGDLEGAEDLLLRALAIEQEQSRPGEDLALVYKNLGEIAIKTGELDKAESLFRKVLAVREGISPGGPSGAGALASLAEIARQRGQLQRAEELLRQACGLYAEHAPGTTANAESLHALATVYSHKGRHELALETLQTAAEVLESLRGRLRGGIEHRGTTKVHRLVYQDLIRSQLRANRADLAFAALERLRARGMLEILAERDLVFTADIPPELDRQRHLLAAEADRTLAELGGYPTELGLAVASGKRGIGGLAPATDADHRALRERLREIRRKQDELRSLIRVASPRLGALTYPEPLDLDGTLVMLEPGTVLLSYSIDEAASRLFVVDASSQRLAVHSLAVDERELRQRIHHIRLLLQSPESSVEEIAKRSSELSEILLGPATDSIAAASRLVILPDGPLHLLPFAALTDPSSTERYLIESRSLSVVASSTVLAQLVNSRRSRESLSVIAFGDPLYPPQPATRALRSSLLGMLKPIPASRSEVMALKTLFGEGTSVFVGADATEERVKSIIADPSILHLAVHALVDEQMPMESAIALTIPSVAAEGADNGLLQVWEIFEQVRIDADLVTLSACETALGAEESGEGLIGLTRAFQYAGARSVLASLWAVADQSTAELMTRFYRHLKDGLPKDEALRQAQIELLDKPITVTRDERTVELDVSHPFYWAALQLVGDWK